MKNYFVYINASFSRVLYVGVTSNLKERIRQHKEKIVKGFTEKYNVDRLVYYEQTENVVSAIAREKQLKGWTRKKKIVLIEKDNSDWRDLYDEL